MLPTEKHLVYVSVTHFNLDKFFINQVFHTTNKHFHYDICRNADSYPFNKLNLLHLLLRPAMQTAGECGGMWSFRFKCSLSFGRWRSVRCIWWLLSCSHILLLIDSCLAGKSCRLCGLCLHCCVLTGHGHGRWCGGWWQGLRRQSRSSAWSTGGQWGFRPVLAGTLHLEWPWSSHLGLSERCHCRYREIWSLYLGRAEKRWGSQKLWSFTSFTAEIWLAKPRSVFWRGLLQPKFTLLIEGSCKTSWHKALTYYISCCGVDDSETEPQSKCLKT